MALTRSGVNTPLASRSCIDSTPLLDPQLLCRDLEADPGLDSELPHFRNQYCIGERLCQFAALIRGQTSLGHSDDGHTHGCRRFWLPCYIEHGVCRGCADAPTSLSSSLLPRRRRRRLAAPEIDDLLGGRRLCRGHLALGRGRRLAARRACHPIRGAEPDAHGWVFRCPRIAHT